MNRRRLSWFCVVMLTTLSLSLATADEAKNRSPQGGAERPAVTSAKRHLRHVVLFKFKETSSAADVERIVTAFRGLPGKITEISEFEWGTDISPEGKAQGFTHCFVVTFASEAARDAYLPHPAHKEFVSIVGPHVDKVCVVDFWAQPTNEGAE